MLCNKCENNIKMKHRKICKVCYKKEVAEYKNTEKGVISVIYHNQINNTRKRGMSDVEYTQVELHEHLIRETDFLNIYGNWVLSFYDKKLKPSIDRLNDYEPYRLDNIQVMTQQEHFEKSGLDRVEGFNLKGSTPVYRISQDGDIKEYSSIHEAARDTGAYFQNIWNVCKGNRKSAAGYKWRFKYEQ